METKDVALVLSSGGPRGFAYIGAIEELESRGYNITSVAGCSIGSLVGGVYAAGGLEAFKKWLFRLNNARLMSLLDVSLSKSYLVKGDKVMEAIKEVVPDVNIEDLRIPYAAVATDLYTGEEVVFREGKLFDAIRASISIPYLFRPMQYGRHKLIDGGIEHARVAEDVLQTLGLSIPTYGMVKDDRHRTRALVTAAGDEIAISAVPSVFALIGTIQEETHRFAITYQRTLRSRRMKASGLADIPGIGEKRRQALLKKFRSVKAISQAGQAELEQVLPVPAAQAVYRHFHPQEGGTACASSQEPPEASR